MLLRLEFQGKEEIGQVVESPLEVALAQVGHFGPADDLETHGLEHSGDETRGLALDAGGVDGQHLLRPMVRCRLHVGLERPH